MSVSVSTEGRPHLNLPASKSQVLRALILASLASDCNHPIGSTELESKPKGSTLSNFTLSGDAKAFLSNSESLYGKYLLHDNTLSVSRGTWIQTPIVHCGQSAFLARTLPFILAALGIETTLTADPQLAKRNHKSLYEVLNISGVKFSISNGTFPLTIGTATFPASITLSSSRSSQPISGLLMALPLLPHPTRVKLEPTVSHGYIDMTLDCISTFQGKFEVQGDDLFFPGSTPYMPADLALEGDWSAAAFFVAALPLLTISGLDFSNLNEYSLQPDSAIALVAKSIGLSVQHESTTLRLANDPNRVKLPFTYDATNTPDIIAPLVALAISCAGTSYISGIHRLENKESNRLEKLVELLSLAEVPYHIQQDTLSISGVVPKGGFTYDPARDHRMAMTAGVLSLATSTPITILNRDCVEKSYPSFFDDLEALRKL